jgi:sugar-specific transcriptional regulator TrmB
MQNITKQLEKLGLSQKEAGIYLALLRIGSATISDIAREAEIKRTTAYQHLDALEKTGLVYKSAKGKRTMFLPEPPDKIAKLMKARQTILENLLPELTTIYQNSTVRPDVFFYNGINGIRTLYDEMTSTPKTLWSAFSADHYLSVFTIEDGDRYLNNVKINGGQLRDMVQDTPRGRKYAHKNFTKEFGETRILPNEIELTAEIMVTGDKTAIVSLVNYVGVIIVNNEIAKTQKNFLEFLWKHSKTLR